MILKFAHLIFCLAIVVPFGLGSSYAADQFGQLIAPEIEKIVDDARTLRLPYSKTPEQAKLDAERAAKSLSEVVKSNPQYYRAWFNLGLALDQAGDAEGANSSFERAIKIRNESGIKDISLLNSAAWVSLSNGDFDTAERRLKMALANIDQGSESTKSAIYNNLGLLYFYTQRFDEAKIYLTRARDEYGSKSAAGTLELIDKTKEIISNQNSLLK